MLIGANNPFMLTVIMLSVVAPPLGSIYIKDIYSDELNKNWNPEERLKQ
jgi:hypothetical protein